MLQVKVDPVHARLMFIMAMFMRRLGSPGTAMLTKVTSTKSPWSLLELLLLRGPQVRGISEQLGIPSTSLLLSTYNYTELVTASASTCRRT